MSESFVLFSRPFENHLKGKRRGGGGGGLEWKTSQLINRFCKMFSLQMNLKTKREFKAKFCIVKVFQKKKQTISILSLFIVCEVVVLKKKLKAWKHCVCSIIYSNIIDICWFYKIKVWTEIQMWNFLLVIRCYDRI